MTTHSALHDSRSTLITTLAGHLRNLDDVLLEALSAEFHPWRNMWQGLIGALYSLHWAIADLSHSSRPFHESVEDARAVLDAIQLGQDFPKEEPRLWHVGYWLNSAEYRIDSIFHQLLKAAYPCEGHHVYIRALAEGILIGACPQCQKPPILPGDVSRGTLERIARDDKDCSLIKLHKWTNELKHHPIPDPDKLAPTERWDTDIDALASLSTMFGDFAIRSGVAASL